EEIRLCPVHGEMDADRHPEISRLPQDGAHEKTEETCVEYTDPILRCVSRVPVREVDGGCTRRGPEADEPCKRVEPITPRAKLLEHGDQQEDAEPESAPRRGFHQSQRGLCNMRKTERAEGHHDERHHGHTHRDTLPEPGAEEFAPGQTVLGDALS